VNRELKAEKATQERLWVSINMIANYADRMSGISDDARLFLRTSAEARVMERIRGNIPVTVEQHLENMMARYEAMRVEYRGLPTAERALTEIFRPRMRR
jgi:hypothetical protein